MVFFFAMLLSIRFFVSVLIAVNTKSLYARFSAEFCTFKKKETVDMSHVGGKSWWLDNKIVLHKRLTSDVKIITFTNLTNCENMCINTEILILCVSEKKY